MTMNMSKTTTSIAEAKNKKKDITALYDFQRPSRHKDNMTIIYLTAISTIAIILAIMIAVISALYRRRRMLCVTSKSHHSQRSLFAEESKPPTLDSLSFNDSTTDRSKDRIKFHSLESLSDESYINSLDKAISYKASVNQKILCNAPPKSTSATLVS